MTTLTEDMAIRLYVRGILGNKAYDSFENEKVQLANQKAIEIVKLQEEIEELLYVKEEY